MVNFATIGSNFIVENIFKSEFSVGVLENLGIYNFYLIYELFGRR